MKIGLYIARLFLLFLFVFAISRLIFLCYFLSDISGQSFISILSSFYYALKVDVSTASYLLVFPLLISLFESIVPFRSGVTIRRSYTFLILSINALITSVDLGLYKEWGVKVNYKALLYLQHPSEIGSTATSGQLIFTLLFALIQAVLSFILYKRFVTPADNLNGENKLVAFISAIILVPLLALGIRGGIQQIPVQAADSYYSTNPHLNWAAVNSLWHLGQSVVAGTQYGNHNPYPFVNDLNDQREVEKLYTSNPDSTISFLHDQQPNIVLIILEGWSADLIESISENKDRSCASHFDTLTKEGILFTNCLASGERSDQGLTAILSSFPSLPLSSIVNYSEKVHHLPSLLKPFKDKGYSSLFLFGGQLSYGNLKTLIYHNGFDKVIEEKDIDPKIYRGRLGVHDEHTFDILHNELNKLKPPFFTGFFTQSTHFSYDYPNAKHPIAWAEKGSDYTNSVTYADSCLGDFFLKAKKEPWYSNTLFVLVSDHSHVLPWNSAHTTSAMHHIPLLFCGDVIKQEYRGTKKTGIVSQQDIAATLLSSLHITHDNFKWSKDVMNPTTSSFAYWTFTEGFGFTQNTSCERVYDLANKKTISAIYQNCDSDQIKRQSFSYLQKVFEDFLSK